MAPSEGAWVCAALTGSPGCPMVTDVDGELSLKGQALGTTASPGDHK